MNYQHPERPCIKVTRINGRGYGGTRVRRERSPYGGWLASVSVSHPIEKPVMALCHTDLRTTLGTSHE